MRVKGLSPLKALALAAVLTVPGWAAMPAMAEKYASFVIDADTDEVLHSRYADEARYPASLTKVMTLYMLFDALKKGELKLNDKLKVSANAAGQAPSNLKLKAGDTITVKNAINALVTKSANDVACVVAERLGGSEARFAQLMTIKARSMGMKNTRFRNASGLPNTRQRSTARDMATLAEAMLEDHGDYYHYFSKQRFSWGGKTYKNHNALLKTVEGTDGIKTGYTRASGFNLMASAKRNDRRVIAVMMGGRTAKSRNTHVAELIEAAFISINEADAKDPNRRSLIAFQNLQKPADPNGAAMPMLNGKLYGAAVTAEGDADDTATPPTYSLSTMTVAAKTAKPVSKPAITRRVTRRVTTAPTRTTRTIRKTAAKPAPTPLPVKKTAPVLRKAAVTTSPASKAPGLSVSEYQARQLAK